LQEILSDELRKNLKAIGEAEIVVGIPSFNNARTIGHVVRACAAGLAKYFPQRKAVIVNSDGGSTDGTREVVLAAEPDVESLLLVQHRVPVVQRISYPYHGVPGKGSAFRMVFAVAQQLRAKACVVVDSDLRSIAPHWIELLAGPVLEREFDFIAPFYLRHKFDGTITNSIIYPLTRALLGKRVRQPIGGDFGISGRLTARFLEKDVWQTDVARFGVDIWMTLTAVAEGFRIGQAYLGAKLHDAKDPGTDLSSMFQQVVGSLFALLETYEAVWRSTKSSESVPMFGFPFDVGVEPIPINIERMVNGFLRGMADLSEIYRLVLAPETFANLAAAARCPRDRLRITDTLWVHIVYDFAASYHHRTMDRQHMLQSLVPLYLGRTASFVMEVWESTAQEVEERLEMLCTTFEVEKSYLEQRWQRNSEKEKSHAESD
jgi:glycosyltransferase involved in cell wall biosynthesis